MRLLESYLSHLRFENRSKSLNAEYFSLRTQLIKLLAAFVEKRKFKDGPLDSGSEDKFMEELRGVEERILGLDKEQERLELEERPTGTSYGSMANSYQ